MKATAAEDGHDLIVFILSFQLTADTNPTGVLLATLNVSGEIFFVGKLMVLR